MKGFKIVTLTKKGEKALTKVILEDNKYLEEKKDDRETKIFFAFFERIIQLNPPKYIVRIKEFVRLRKTLNRIVNKNVLMNNLLNNLPLIEENALDNMKEFGAILKKDFEVEKIE